MDCDVASNVPVSDMLKTAYLIFGGQSRRTVPHTKLTVIIGAMVTHEYLYQ